MKPRRQWIEDAAIWAAYWIVVGLAIGFMLFLMVTTAHCGENEERLAILASLAAIDYTQTAGKVNPGGIYEEANPILGPHPSRGDLLTFGAAGLGLAYLTAKILPKPWGRIALDSAISTEQWNIEANRSLEQGRPQRISAMPIILTIRW